jgi:hypothetical protein
MNRLQFSISSLAAIGAVEAVRPTVALAAPSASFVAASSKLSSVSLPPKPDPNSTLNQLIYTADFAARFVGTVGVTEVPKLIAAISAGQWETFLPILQEAAKTDKDVARLTAVLQAYTAHPELQNAQSFGYFACIVISNTSAGTTDPTTHVAWNPLPLPYGTPNP